MYYQRSDSERLEEVIECVFTRRRESKGAIIIGHGDIVVAVLRLVHRARREFRSWTDHQGRSV